MPGGDRTGPLGAGPRTGRAAGYCTGNRVPGFANPVRRGFGGGAGFGFGNRGFSGGGFGRGRRNRFFAPGSPGMGRRASISADYGYDQPGAFEEVSRNEREYLLTEAESLKAMLDDINKRLDEINASEKGSK